MFFRMFFVVNPPWALASGCATSLLEPGSDCLFFDGVALLSGTKLRLGHWNMVLSSALRLCFEGFLSGLVYLFILLI